MKFLFYTHSLVSDWNHGNAHFLRGVMRELQALGHEALALEPEDGWSRTHLREELGEDPQRRFQGDFPELRSRCYGPAFDHEAALAAADVVIVHEWTDPALVARIGKARARGGRFLLAFHDTHHRAVSASDEIGSLDLDGYDFVLAFGETLRRLYARAGWGGRALAWHEAADIRLFRPQPGVTPERDIVWVGNWGDGERERELREFLLEPARRLGLTGRIHGVRYPDRALRQIEKSGLEYQGWISNAQAPMAFALARATVHVPRRPYVEALPGIPTIRVFEALACGIPLVCAPWDDCEGLFRPGKDFLTARNEAEMETALHALTRDGDLAAEIAANGFATVRARHTCAHRARELLGFVEDVAGRGWPVREAAQ